MSKFQYDEDPIIVCRDCGYNIVDLLTPENRKKARERMKNPNYVSEAYLFKEFFGEIGIVVHPEKMTNWYAFTD